MHLALSQGNLILTVLGLGLLVLKGYALVDCVTRPASAFPAHGKLTKQIWLAILAVATLLALVTSVLNLLSLVGTVAAIVYVVDVKPAVSGSNPW